MTQNKIKLMIVDDEKDICKFVKMLFGKRGFLVYSSVSGKEAIRIAKKVKPDIALLDIYLKKGMDGLDVLRQIREIIPSCRCAIVTWDESQEKVKEAKRLGAAYYVTKPLTTSGLLKTVRRLAKSAGRKRGW